VGGRTGAVVKPVGCKERDGAHDAVAAVRRHAVVYAQEQRARCRACARNRRKRTQVPSTRRSSERPFADTLCADSAALERSGRLTEECGDARGKRSPWGSDPWAEACSRHNPETAAHGHHHLWCRAWRGLLPPLTSCGPARVPASSPRPPSRAPCAVPPSRQPVTRYGPDAQPIALGMAPDLQFNCFYGTVRLHNWENLQSTIPH